MKEERKLTIVATINKNSVIDTETDMVGYSEKEIMVGILEAAQLANNVDTINPN